MFAAAALLREPVFPVRLGIATSTPGFLARGHGKVFSPSNPLRREVAIKFVRGDDADTFVA